MSVAIFFKDQTPDISSGFRLSPVHILCSYTLITSRLAVPGKSSRIPRARAEQSD
jgi:hypothetical protein